MDQPFLPGWHPTWHAGVGPQPPPERPISAAFAAAIEDDNPDEWEYEYSTTEFETYYVTLDLSTPDVQQPQPAPEDAARKTTRWANPAIGRHKRPNVSEPHTFATQTYSVDPNPSNPVEEQEKNPEVEVLVPAIEKPRKPPPVQILGLHSHNPVISYNGHVYSCQWASNLGTELLFTTSAGNPHPYLRTVPGEVDILGACSARIISKAIEIQPKSPLQQPVPKPLQRKKGSGIQLSRYANTKRQAQASFLEKLIAVKSKKGEKDMVTVHALKRLSNKAWREEFQSKRQLERARLNQLAQMPGDEGVAALNRLAEMNREDEMRRQEEHSVPKRRRPSRAGQKNDFIVPVLPGLATDTNIPPKTPQLGQDGPQPRDENMQSEDEEDPNIYNGRATPEGSNGFDNEMNEDVPEDEDEETEEDVSFRVKAADH